MKVVNDTPVDLTDNGASSWLNFSGAVSNLPDGAVLGDMSFGISNPAALAGFGVWTSPATNCLALTDANVMVSEGGPSLLTDGFSADVLDFYKNFVGTIEMVFTSSLDEGDIVFSFFTGGSARADGGLADSRGGGSRRLALAPSQSEAGVVIICRCGLPYDAPSLANQ